MQRIDTALELTNAIRQLEKKQIDDWEMLHEQLLITYENIKPLNVIKQTISKLTSTPEFKGNIIDTTLSIAIGYLSKKVIIGSSHQPLKSLIGTFLQMGLTNVALKNAVGIKSALLVLLKSVMKKNITASTPA